MTTETPVPAHIRTANPPGNFCTREGQLAPNGHCPDGCDHADHYANDGHPECEEVMRPYHRWPSTEDADRPASMDRCLRCQVRRFSDEPGNLVAANGPCFAAGE